MLHQQEEGAVPSVVQKDGSSSTGGNEDSGCGIVVDGDGRGSTQCCHGIKQFILYDSLCKNNQAFYLNQFGRSVLFMSSVFVSLGVLQLANQQAGCQQNANGSYTDCGNTVYRMRPSSMLALMASIGGVSTSCTMPFAGAVLDFSNHRLEFGKVNALLLTLTSFAQIFLTKTSWFPIVILQSSIGSATFMANQMVLWSYISAPNDHAVASVMASGGVWETFGMFGLFIVVGVVQFQSGWDSVNIARFSQAFATSVGGASLFLAFKRYMPVKAIKKPDGSDVNLYLAGLRELKSTVTTLGKTDPSAARFLVCSIFVEASQASFTPMAISYLSEQVRLIFPGR